MGRWGKVGAGEGWEGGGDGRRQTAINIELFFRSTEFKAMVITIMSDRPIWA